MLDLVKAGIAADGLCVYAGNFKAVVRRSVMRSGNLHAAACAEMVDGETPYLRASSVCGNDDARIARASCSSNLARPFCLPGRC